MKSFSCIPLFFVIVGTHAFNFNTILKQTYARRYANMAATDVIKINPRDERRRIIKSDNYNRMGFKEEKADVAEMMVTEFTSPLVAELRANKGIVQRGDVTGI